MDDQRVSSPFAPPRWTRRTAAEIVLAVVAGFALAMTVQLTLGWWLDSAEGVAAVMAAAFFASLVVFRAWYAALAFWAATMNGMTIILFYVGPGSIFPIVIVIGGVMTGLAVLAGWILALGLRHVWAITRVWPRA